MKILIEFKVEDNKERLNDLLNEINNLNVVESNYDWTVKKYPKRYKRIVEDWV